MIDRTQFQAKNPLRRMATRYSISRRLVTLSGLAVYPAVYPEVPAGWPNRATRRAIKQGREQRLSSEWRQVLAQQFGPQLRVAIKAL